MIKTLSKALLACAMIYAPMTAKAQVNTLFVYGSAGYEQQKYSDNISTTTSNTWSVVPMVGYQVSDAVTVGIEGGYSKLVDKFPNYYYQITTMYAPYPVIAGYTQHTEIKWGIGAFARYTKWFGKRFFVYGQLDASHVSANSKYTLDEKPGGIYSVPNGLPSQVDDGYGYIANLVPAIGVIICKGFALNFNMGGINYTYLQSFSDAHSCDIKVTLGQEFVLGISKNFSFHKNKVADTKSITPAGE